MLKRLLNKKQPTDPPNNPVYVNTRSATGCFRLNSCDYRGKEHAPFRSGYEIVKTRSKRRQA